jgi:hypothetical protein
MKLGAKKRKIVMLYTEYSIPRWKLKIKNFNSHKIVFDKM